MPMAPQVGHLLHLALVATALLFLCSSYFATPAFAMSSQGAPPPDLVIETLYLPANAASLPKTRTKEKISVHYTGTLFTTGAKFDSSRDRGKPFDVSLGAALVIKGWDEGLVGMVVGERRKLIIPPHKAYADKGFGDIIPPYSTLVFDVELMKIHPKEEL